MDGKKKSCQSLINYRMVGEDAPKVDILTSGAECNCHLYLGGDLLFPFNLPSFFLFARVLLRTGYILPSSERVLIEIKTNLKDEGPLTFFPLARRKHPYL